jgi:hypothetical protein
MVTNEPDYTHVYIMTELIVESTDMNSFLRRNLKTFLKLLQLIIPLIQAKLNGTTKAL